MYHYGRNASQSSAARPAPPGRSQTRSYQQQQRPVGHSSGSLSPRQVSQPQSLQLPRGSSFNFFSVISKFEALDALSVPHRISVRQGTRGSPLPAKTAATPHRGRTEFRIQSNYGNPLSLRRESKARDPGAGDPRGSYFPLSHQSTKYSLNTATFAPGRQPSNSPLPFYEKSSSKPRNGLYNAQSDIPEPAKRNWVSPDSRKTDEPKARLISIRDMINYFDGAIDAAIHAELIPPPIEPPKTPLSRIRMHNQNSFSLITNKLAAKRDITPRKLGHDTSTKYSPLPVQKKRNSAFGYDANTPNPCIQAASPPKTVATSAPLEQLYNEEPANDQSRRIFVRSPARSTKPTHPPVSNRMRGAPIERNGSISPGKQPMGRLLPVGENELPPIDARKEISERIETINRAKSFDRAMGYSLEPESRASITKYDSMNVEKPTTNQGIKPQFQTSTPRKRPEPSSKVSMMKSIFERPPTFKGITTHKVDEHPNRPTPMSITMTTNRHKSTLIAIPPAPQTLDARRNDSLISPTSVPTSSKTAFPFKSPSTSNYYPWGAHTTGIDGTKDFRTPIPNNNRKKDGPQDSTSMSPPLLPRQPLNHSLTAAALPPPPFQATHSNEPFHRGLIATTAQMHSTRKNDTPNTRAEFPFQISENATAAASATRANKRKSFIEQWNSKLPGPSMLQLQAISNLTNENMVTDGAGDSRSSSFSEADDRCEVMVVKEADCRLREPKPLRITEMKRMVLLCRGKAGGVPLTGERKERVKL